MQVSDKKKKHSSSPAIVSTNCSRLKSFHFSCKPHFLCSKSSDHHLVSDPLPRSTTTLPPPQKCNISDGKDAAEEYWKRAEQLELELKKLDKWLDTEKKLRDSLNYRINETCSAQFEVKTTGKSCGRKTQVEAVELIRVAGGGYVHKFSTSALMGRSCRNLAMQVSPLVMLPTEDWSNIFQVLKRMNEMGRENMMTWLLKSMPLPDISSMEIVDGSPIITPCSDSSAEDFLEAIFVRATEELKRLVVEGLQIKNGSAEKVEKDMQKKKDEEAKKSIIEVMLIRVRDPDKHYRAVGNLMVGFVEASVADAEDSEFFIKQVYVAGINSEKSNDNGNENENFQWCIST